MRKQFTFYKSFLESIEKLPTNKEKLQAYETLCHYALDQNDLRLDGVKPSVYALFQAIRPTLDTAHARSVKTKYTLDNLDVTCNNL